MKPIADWAFVDLGVVELDASLRYNGANDWDCIAAGVGVTFSEAVEDARREAKALGFAVTDEMTFPFPKTCFENIVPADACTERAYCVLLCLNERRP
jgi:hypothetical protein